MRTIGSSVDVKSAIPHFSRSGAQGTLGAGGSLEATLGRWGTAENPNMACHLVDGLFLVEGAGKF